MGPLLALACRNFRENVINTCKIGSFSCTLDNFLLKNVIVFIFRNNSLKWRPFEKRAIFAYFPHFQSPGKDINKDSFTT